MILFFVFILGLAAGSFISASAWRLYINQFADKRKLSKKILKLKPGTLSISKGRSVCEYCGHQLAAKDLVPVLSWISLKGKCRYCQTKLSWEYPAVELVTGLLFMASYWSWSFTQNADYVSFALWLAVLSALILLALFDIKWMLLPNAILYPLIAVATAWVIVQGVFFGGGAQLIKDSVLGLAFVGGIFYLLFIVSKGKWIGGGDVKLGIFIGIFLGFYKSILAFILAFNLAALIILPLLLLGLLKRRTPIPFGPFLILATIISVLYGAELIQWYSDMFLYGLI